MKILFTKAFTIIELLAVVAIIAVLSSIAVPSYINYVKTTKVEDIKATFNQAAERMMMCASSGFTDVGSCPSSSKNFFFTSLDGGLDFASKYDYQTGDKKNEAMIYIYFGGTLGNEPSLGIDYIVPYLYIQPDTSTVGGYVCYYWYNWKTGIVEFVYNYAYDGSYSSTTDKTCNAR